MLQIPEFEHIRAVDPDLYLGLIKMQQAITQSMEMAGVGIGGNLPAPPQIGSIIVTAENGFFNITINDNQGATLGVARPINYFVVYGTSSNLSVASSPTVHLGPVRALNNFFLGNETYYFGAYSQFGAGSPISPLVIFQGGVSGGGSITPPTLPSTPVPNISGIGAGGGYGIGNKVTVPTRGNLL